MNLEYIVISLEYAKKLKELGVRQKSIFYWVESELYPRLAYKLQDMSCAIGCINDYEIENYMNHKWSLDIIDFKQDFTAGGIMTNIVSAFTLNELLDMAWGYIFGFTGTIWAEGIKIKLMGALVQTKESMPQNAVAEVIVRAIESGDTNPEDLITEIGGE